MDISIFISVYILGKVNIVKKENGNSSSKKRIKIDDNQLKTIFEWIFYYSSALCCILSKWNILSNWLTETKFQILSLNEYLYVSYELKNIYVHAYL